MATVLNTLYPPQVMTAMPAFAVVDGVAINDPVVTFSLSPYNEISKIKRIHLSVVDSKTGMNALANDSGVYIVPFSGEKDKKTGLYEITIPSEIIKSGFNTGQYYKIQLRFDTNDSGYDNEEPNPTVVSEKISSTITSLNAATAAVTSSNKILETIIGETTSGQENVFDSILNNGNDFALCEDAIQTKALLARELAVINNIISKVDDVASAVREEKQSLGNELYDRLWGDKDYVPQESTLNSLASTKLSIDSLMSRYASVISNSDYGYRLLALFKEDDAVGDGSHGLTISDIDSFAKLGQIYANVMDAINEYDEIQEPSGYPSIVAKLTDKVCSEIAKIDAQLRLFGVDLFFGYRKDKYDTNVFYGDKISDIVSEMVTNSAGRNNADLYTSINTLPSSTAAYTQMTFMNKYVNLLRYQEKLREEKDDYNDVTVKDPTMTTSQITNLMMIVSTLNDVYNKNTYSCKNLIDKLKPSDKDYKDTPVFLLFDEISDFYEQIKIDVKKVLPTLYGTSVIKQKLSAFNSTTGPLQSLSFKEIEEFDDSELSDDYIDAINALLPNIGINSDLLAPLGLMSNTLSAAILSIDSAFGTAPSPADEFGTGVLGIFGYLSKKSNDQYVHIVGEHIKSVVSNSTIEQLDDDDAALNAIASALLVMKSLISAYDDIYDNDDAAVQNQYLISNMSKFSEWSSVCLIRPIDKPRVNLPRFADSSVASFNYGTIPISGYMDFENRDETEAIDYYQVSVLSEDGGEVLLEGDKIYVTNNMSMSRREISTSLDSFKLATEGTQEYQLDVHIVTENQYDFHTYFRFEMMDYVTNSSFDPIINLSFDQENALMTIDILNTMPVQGVLYVKRACSRDDYNKWENFYVTAINGTIDLTLTDNTTAAGYWYRYSAQVLNSANTSSHVVVSDIELSDYQSAFLSRGSRQFSAMFNFEITSFRRNTNRVKIDTLGGKYPKFAENGEMKYHEFSMNATITALADALGLFMKKTDMLDYDDYSAFVSMKHIYDDNDYVYEKRFRDALYEWLDDGEIKLFRSQPEGNYCVMLADVTISPKQELGRLIWDVSATAYEVGDGYSLDALDSYGVYRIAADGHGGDGTSRLPSDIGSIDIKDAAKTITTAVHYEYVPSTNEVIDLRDLIADYIKETYYVNGGDVMSISDIRMNGVTISFYGNTKAFYVDEHGNVQFDDQSTESVFINNQTSSSVLGYRFALRQTSDNIYDWLLVLGKSYYDVDNDVDVEHIYINCGDGYDKVCVDCAVTYELMDNEAINTIVGVSKYEAGRMYDEFAVGESLSDKISDLIDIVYVNTINDRTKMIKRIALNKIVGLKFLGWRLGDMGYSAGNGIVISSDGKISFDIPYVSLERLDSHLYTAAFNDVPEYEKIGDISAFGCSTFVKDGKMYRNLDWYYSDAITFIVKCNGFYGTAFLDAITNDNMDIKLINQLPYHMRDGRNDHGIMVSTHVMYNDWSWSGYGKTPISKLPYIILSTIDSLDDFDEKMEDVLGNLYAPTSDHLLQFLVSDGTSTYVIAPPEQATGPYQIIDITENPKLTNFRWVQDDIVSREDLQEHPTGVERWNMMPDCTLSDLKFTLAYESPDRLSEFIGMNGTTKDSTDEELESIYLTVKNLYDSRDRDGSTWQTVHSVIYSQSGIEAFYVQEDFDRNYAVGHLTGPRGRIGETGTTGIRGRKGDTGATFTPSVSNDGVLSWTNDRNLPNHAPVVVRGEGIPDGGTNGQVMIRSTNSTSGTLWTDPMIVDATLSDVSTNAIQNKVVKRHVDDWDSAQKKRIANLEAATKGILYTTDRDDDVAWRKDVQTGVMRYAQVEKVGGKTLVWNQLFPSRSSKVSVTVAGVNVTRKVGYDIVFDGTATAYAGTNSEIVNVGYNVAGHKFFHSGNSELSHTQLYYRANSADSWHGLSKQSGAGGIFTIPTGVEAYQLLMGWYVEEGHTYYYIVMQANLIDLTLMFGQGNEPSTVAEFRKIFPADYYPYSAPTLISAGVVEVESMGKNLLVTGVSPDTTTDGVSFKRNDDGSITINGTADKVVSFKLNYIDYYDSVSDVRQLVGQQVTCSIEPDSGVQLSCRAFNRNRSTYAVCTSYDNKTGVIADDSVALLCYIFVAKGATFNNVTVHPQLELGSTATSYSPYWTRSISIGPEIRALCPLYGASAGNVYNEIDFTTKKYIQRVAAVDLGTLTWYYEPNDTTFKSSGIGHLAAVPDTTNDAPNAICSTYRTSNYSQRDNKSFTIIWKDSTVHGAIWIKNDDYTSAATFKAAMNGVMLYYELATPVEVDLSSVLPDDAFIEVEGGGSLTMKNSYGNDYMIPVPNTEQFLISVENALESS